MLKKIILIFLISFSWQANLFSMFQQFYEELDNDSKPCTVCNCFIYKPNNDELYKCSNYFCGRYYRIKNKVMESSVIQSEKPKEIESHVIQSEKPVEDQAKDKQQIKFNIVYLHKFKYLVPVVLCLLAWKYYIKIKNHCLFNGSI